MNTRLTRREFTVAIALGASGVLTMNAKSSPVDMRPADAAVDHIILAVSDLDAGIAYVAEKTGVRPVPSGTHPGRGTRNALAALGGRRYLEVLAPDPAQSVDTGMVAEVRKLTEPTIIGWAISSNDLIGIRTKASGAKLDPTDIMPGARVTPSGDRLEWETVGVGVQFDGLMPFAIRWKTEAHPSTTSPAGITLESLWFEHPDPGGLKKALAELGVEARVEKAKQPRIRVSVKSAKQAGEL